MHTIRGRWQSEMNHVCGFDTIQGLGLTRKWTIRLDAITLHCFLPIVVTDGGLLRLCGQRLQGPTRVFNVGAQSGHRTPRIVGNGLLKNSPKSKPSVAVPPKV